MDKRSLFWRGFWIALLAIFGVWLFLSLQGEFLQQKHQDTIKAQENKIQLQAQLQELLDLAPAEIKQALSTPKFQEHITAIIKEHTDLLFTQLYAQIPRYADFHYSLKGEYLELWAYSQDDGGKYLQKYLFDAVDFDAKMLQTYAQIGDAIYRDLHLSLGSITDSLASKTQLDIQERDILNKILDLQIQSTLHRFEESFANSLRAGGVVGAGAMGVVLAKKIGAKLALKAGTKLGAALGAGASGMVLCAPTGLGALACGAATGLAGWFGTDKIILEGDAYLHREAFEAELARMIQEEQNATIHSIQQSFSTLLLQTQKEYTHKLQQSVQERLKEISKQEQK